MSAEGWDGRRAPAPTERVSCFWRVLLIMANSKKAFLVGALVHQYVTPARCSICDFSGVCGRTSEGPTVALTCAGNHLVTL